MRSYLSTLWDRRLTQVQQSKHRRLAPKAWSTRVGVIVFFAFIFAAIAAPVLSHYNPTDIDLSSALEEPTVAHLFGTDYLGRDVLTRVLYGARVDLQIGLIGVAIPFTIGTLIGVLAGYMGGVTDVVISRIIDVVIAFPFLVLVVAIVAMLGPGLVNLYIGITVVSWVLYARITRGETMSVRQRDYIVAAEGLGFSQSRIMVRHILRNVVAPALIFTMSDFVLDLQLGATLSFFGLGVRPPRPEWGAMIAESRNYMLTAPWTVLFPGLAIIILSFSVSLIGEGLADRVRGLHEH